MQLIELTKHLKDRGVTRVTIRLRNGRWTCGVSARLPGVEPRFVAFDGQTAEGAISRVLLSLDEKG